MTITPALAKEGFFIGIGVNGVDHKTLTISKGDFVDWQNHDPSGSPPVTVTSDSGAFSSGDIKPGEIFDHTFNTQGT